jgi:hypothetical protein
LSTSRNAGVEVVDERRPSRLLAPTAVRSMVCRAEDQSIRPSEETAVASEEATAQAGGRGISATEDLGMVCKPRPTGPNGHSDPVGVDTEALTARNAEGVAPDG